MIQPPEGHFVAHYYLEARDGGLRKAATKIAVEETTGSWVGAGEPTDLFKRSMAHIVDLQEIEPDRKGLVTIAFPLQNMPVDKYFIASFWLFMTGGPLYERMFCDTVRLMDFGLPTELLDALPGPRFGMKGTRQFLGLPDDEIVIATIVKPCAGLTAQEVADKCREAAMGGIDFIKDDEKMSNPPYCPLEDRVRLVAEGLRQAHEETGRKVIYCPHISTRPDKIVDDARIAVENGATGLMLNAFAAGFTAIQLLAENPDLNVPIYVHSGGRGAWSRFPGFGVDVNVVARMIRMCGGDFFRAHMIDGYLIADTRQRSIELVNLLREPMGRLKDMVPALSGGLGADNLVQNLEAFGLDILPMAGGAVLGHPMGIQAGVLALRQAAESVEKKIPLDDYAKDHPELKAALDRARGQ